LLVERGSAASARAKKRVLRALRMLHALLPVFLLLEVVIHARWMGAELLPALKLRAVIARVKPILFLQRAESFACLSTLRLSATFFPLSEARSPTAPAPPLPTLTRDSTALSIR
ncbi:unnamed protein product, partial [Laminaria digitata]